MKGVVFIILNYPPYFNFNEVKMNSYYMSKYVNDHIIENMRELYIKDKTTLNQLRKELHIRGIGFKKEYQNNFLKGIEFELYPFIKVENENERYKRFPFDLFGLSQIIDDLKISSDKFFNYIPINGFDKYIPREKKELFMAKLKEFDFQLIYESDVIYDEHKGMNKMENQNITNYIPEKVYPHFIKFCKLNGYNIKNLEKALQTYKSAKGTRLKTYEKLYEYCINNELILPNGESKYNFINFELDNLLKNAEMNYFDFMEGYFSEKNLMSDKPYLYGEKVLRNIFEKSSVSNEVYLADLESELTKLRNHDNYILIKDMYISDIINQYSLSNIFIKEYRVVKDLGTMLYDKNIIKILNNFLDSFPVFSTIKDKILSILSEKEYKILRERNEGYTLEEIAQELKVTRERVRQIEKRAKRNLKESKQIKESLYFILFKYKTKSIIHLPQVLRYLNLEVSDAFIVEILLEEHAKYLIYKEYMIIITRKLYKSIYDEVNWYVLNNYPVIPLNELENVYEETMEFATKLLNELNYKLVKNNFVQANITLVATIEYIMSRNKDKIFVNNDEGYEILKSKIESVFDKNIDSSPRALFARVADASNVILVDRNAYKYEDFESIDGDFLVELKELVDDQLSQGQYADPRIIYKDSPKLMSENRVYSYSHLYSIIKNFYADDYKVGYQNTLYIFPKKSNKLSAEAILNSYLMKHSPVEIDVLIEDLNWKRIKLEQMVPRLDDVIFSGNQEVILIKGIEEENTYSDLYNLINDEVKKGYLITADLYIKVIFDTHLSVLINKYDIKDLHSFAQLIKSKFMFMLGHSQFLYSKYSEFRNIEDVMANELPKLINSKELQNYLVEKGYSEQRYYKAKDVLIEKNQLIPYNNEIFLNLEKFKFSKNFEENILGQLSFEFEQSVFLTKKQLTKIDTDLDDSLRVTPEIVTHIAKVNGYHLLEAYYGSLYELPIITCEKFDSYAELVYKIVKQKFNDIYNEENLLAFLKTYGLVNENADQIYFTIKESGYFTFDNLGFFQINEEGVSSA